MSLSSVAVAQREKEAKSLNAFLTFSLIGSLALHIGVLSLGIGKFLSKAPEVENEPIEIAIMELPSPPKLELKQETKASGSGAGKNRTILSNSGSSTGFGVATDGGVSQEKSPSPKKIASSNSSEVLKAQPAPQKLPQRSSQIISTPQQNQRTNPEKVPAKIVTQLKPVIAPIQNAPSEIVTKPKPVLAPASVSVAKVKPIPVDTFNERSSQVQQLNNQRLNNLLAKARNSREQALKVSNSNAIAAQQGKVAANLRNQIGNGVGTGSSTSNRGTGTGNGTGTSNRGTGTGNGTGSGNGTGTGTRNGTGSGNGTGTGTGDGTGTNNRGAGTGNGGAGTVNNVQSGSTVATGTRNIERRTSQEESNTNYTNPRSSSGRLACRTCSKPKYPENARKRRLEGKAEISVDVDKKGNVTNVRLAQTSGHAELDKAAVEQARNWKFNTPNGAAQGVTAKVDFAIEGSKKSRQNQERRRQRATARKQPVASSQNTQTTPVVRTPARQNTNTALNRSLRRQSSTVRRRRVDTLPPRQALEKPQRQRRQPSVSQTRLRNTLRRQQRAVSPNPATIRRQQPQAASPNQTKLRQSLRLHKQSQSTPSTNSNEP